MSSAGIKCTPYLTPGETIVKVSFHGQIPVMVNVPDRVTCKVASVEPSRGDSSHSWKTAILENGESLSVPDFIKADDVVKVDLENMIYKERIMK
jgi:elongation factor P